MRALISKRVSQNRTKYCNKQNKQTTIFLPKINKVFLSPILQNLKGKSVLDNFFENDPLNEPKNMPWSEKFYLLRMIQSKTQVGGQNGIYPSSLLRDFSLLWKTRKQITYHSKGGPPASQTSSSAVGRDGSDIVPLRTITTIRSIIGAHHASTRYPTQSWNETILK